MSVTDRFNFAHNIPPPGEVPLGDLLRVLWRRQRAIFLVVVVTTVMAVTIGLLREKTYTATALVMIQPQQNRIVDLQQVAQGLSASPRDLETEIKFISSHENLARAVDRLDLKDNPTLIFPEQESGAIASVISVSRPIAGAADDGPNHDQDADANAFRESAITALSGGLEVLQSGNSNILAISYTAIDPSRAALLADGIAKAYVDSQLAQKLAETEHAKSWLTDQVAGLRLKVMELERTIEQFRAAHDLTEAGGGQLDGQLVAALTTQLIDAHADRTSKEAALQQVHELRNSGDYELLAGVLSSPMIMNLREQELELLRNEAELSGVYGEQHPRIQELQAEKARVAERTQREIESAIRGLENDAAVARSREGAFQESLKDAKSQSALSGPAEVQLRELEREAAANRTLYENFLVRVKETELQQQLIEPDARVVSPAQVPQVPSSRSPMFFAIIGFTGSLFIGSTLAMVLEQMDSSLRTRRQVEEQLGVKALGLVPAVDDTDPNLSAYLGSKPGSAYAEGVRTVYTQLRWADAAAPPQVLLVTSALPGEGKTSLAISLAMCAAQLRQKTVLIDLDLRQPAVGRRLGLEVEVGVLELIADDARRFDDVVRPYSDSGVDVLAVAQGHRSPVPFLACDRLQLLLEEARGHYDCIIVDTPPVLGVADVKVLTRHVDGVLFVIRWQRTKRDAAQSALKELSDVSANVIGAAFNNVDMRRHAYYAYGDAGQYFSKYSRYYYN